MLGPVLTCHTRAHIVIVCVRLHGCMGVAHRVLPLLVLLGAGLPVADEVVQRAVLNECGENEDEADRDEEVHGRHVGDLGQRLPGDGTQRGHGQHGGDA